MTAGLYPGGVGPAGVAPITASPTTRPKLPRAMRYEGTTRDWPLESSSGAYRAVTPVEQGFVLALCVRQGDIKASPTTGNSLHEIEYVGDSDLAADIRDRVVNANPIKRYLDEGQAELVRIDVDERPHGFNVAVFFKDLTADKNKTLQADAFVRR